MLLVLRNKDKSICDYSINSCCDSTLYVSVIHVFVICTKLYCLLRLPVQHGVLFLPVLISSNKRFFDVYFSFVAVINLILH